MRRASGDGPLLPCKEVDGEATIASGQQTFSTKSGQDWKAYHQAKTNEPEIFPRLLRGVCAEVEEPEYVFGCPPLPLHDMLFSIVTKVYSLRPCRQFTCDLKEFYKKEFISMVPTPSSISDYMRKEAVTPLLHQILVKSSLPLAQVEDCFAVDSTGLGIPCRVSYFNRHTGRRVKKRGYKKLHIMCGVITNIITAAEVTEGTASDRNYLRPLLQRTSQYFNVGEVYADGGYLSGENYRAVILSGGRPYIAFAKNCVLDADYKSQVWKEALQLWKSRHPDFMRRFNLRSNVESTFSSLKARFGDRLRSKSLQGQINEALCKAICHNICVLIQETFERGINPTSWSDAKLTPRAESGSLGRALTDEENEMVRDRIAAATTKSKPEGPALDAGGGRGRRAPGDGGPAGRERQQYLLFAD